MGYADPPAERGRDSRSELSCVVHDGSDGTQCHQDCWHTGFAKDRQAKSHELHAAGGGTPWLKMLSQQVSQRSSGGRRKGGYRVVRNFDTWARACFQSQVRLGLEAVGCKGLNPTIGIIQSDHFGPCGAHHPRGRPNDGSHATEVSDDHAMTPKPGTRTSKKLFLTDHGDAGTLA